MTMPDATAVMMNDVCGENNINMLDSRSIESVSSMLYVVEARVLYQCYEVEAWNFSIATSVIFVIITGTVQ